MTIKSTKIINPPPKLLSKKLPFLVLTWKMNTSQERSWRST